MSNTTLLKMNLSQLPVFVNAHVLFLVFMMSVMMSVMMYVYSLKNKAPWDIDQWQLVTSGTCKTMLT